MILDYPIMEAYTPETIKEITHNVVKRSRRKVIQEYQENVDNSGGHLVTITKVWDWALKDKDFGKLHMKSIFGLTDILIWEQANVGQPTNAKTLKLLNPDHVKDELVRRNLHWRDVYEEEKEHLYSWSASSIRNIYNAPKKTKPSWDLITYLTKFLIEFDNNILDLPKNPGVRWDIEEWRRTSNIPIKNSWEEAKD